jgi:uncharacterized membrane protein
MLAAMSVSQLISQLSREAKRRSTKQLRESAWLCVHSANQTWSARVTGVEGVNTHFCSIFQVR